MAYVSALSNGAPVQACDTLSPDPQSHGADPTNCSQPCPFSLEPYDILGVDGSNFASELKYFCGSLHNSKVALGGF